MSSSEFLRKKADEPEIIYEFFENSNHKWYKTRMCKWNQSSCTKVEVEADIDLTPYKGQPSIKQTNHGVLWFSIKMLVYCIKDRWSNELLTGVPTVTRYCVALAF